MNSEKFKSLGIEQQVEYINKLLETLSLTKACANVGIARKTLSDQFERAGYKLDKTIKKYVKTGNSNTNNTIEPIQKEQEQNKKANNIKVLENRVESLEKQIEGIMSILETTNTNVATNEIEIKTFKGEKVARSYKINIEVQKQFKAFCKAHSEYEVGDILATAMLELMNKYK